MFFLNVFKYLGMKYLYISRLLHQSYKSLNVLSLLFFQTMFNALFSLETLNLSRLKSRSSMTMGAALLLQLEELPVLCQAPCHFTNS